MAEASTSASAGATTADTDHDTDRDSDTPRILRTRKRVRRVSEWKKTQRKTRRNSGKGYTTKKKKEVPAKQFDNTPCGCALRCFEKVSEEQRQRLFDGFWRSSDFNVQNAYICGCVKVLEISRRYTSKGSSSRRSNTRVYYMNDGRRDVRVCKTAFLRTHAVSNGRLTRALKASADNYGSPQGDRRGRHTPANKTSDADIAFVKEHIQSFPKYQSHYSRADNPVRQYLNPDLSITKMYILYKDVCSTEEKSPVSEGIYRKVFNEDFNLSFGRPKSDTCKECDSYKVQTDAEQDEATLAQLKGEWELHLCKAERAHHQLKEDAGVSKCDPNVMMVTFDLQQSLPTPVLTTNVVFYKRQLWTYNLGVHDCRSCKGYMYVWHEGTASRGSSEIGSCILKHIQVTKPTETHLITFSDSCGGQNRNIYLLALWLHMVASDQYSFTTIDQKFMVVGHSYLPNDRDFGSIETARRRASHLYVPTDWSDLIRNCRRKNPFTVTDMARNDFVSLRGLPEAFVNRKVTTKKQKVDWLQIRWIRVSKDKPLQFRFRYSHNTLEEWKVVDLKRKTKGRPPDMGRILPTELHSRPRPIKAAKKKDLMDLLEFVPPIHHAFYRDLLSGGGTEDSEDEHSESENSEQSDQDSDTD